MTEPRYEVRARSTEREHDYLVGYFPDSGSARTAMMTQIACAHCYSTYVYDREEETMLAAINDPTHRAP